jgi:SAM-dependent methyltransferase
MLPPCKLADDAVDVFGAAMQSVGFLRDAAIAAACELGVFAALSRGPASLDELAEAIGVGRGRRRLRALLDVLAAIGVLTCERCERAATPRFATPAAVPPCPVVSAAGWGRLAEVIRRDRPLPATDGVGAGAAGDGAGAAGDGAGAAGDGERRFHHHLARAGAAAAEELVGQLGATSLLDLGAGAGAYSRAFLAARPERTATLVDTRGVLGLAAEWLGSLAARARFVEGDASEVDAGDGYGAALLANVLHLHPPDMCARLVAAAARAVAPGGVVVIKDLRVDDDRTGPLEGLLFAVNMAIYTEAGDVYPTSQLHAWLAAAGLVDIEARRLVAAPDAVVLIARRPLDPELARRGQGAIGDSAESDAVAAELDAALARTAGEAWCALAGGQAIGGAAAAGPPILAFPRALRTFLVAAVGVERRDGGAGDAAAAARADQLVRHYTDAMPRMRVAQLAGTTEPGAALFHTRLDWARLPRLGGAIDRLFAVLADAGVAGGPALGAASADEFRARTPTLAALYERTHYGGFMPLLYGFPADLAYFAARGVAEHRDVLATIDRYLTAPIVHELCHFAPGRDVAWAPHLDECIAGWLGAHVHPELAYPAGDHDDALYAAPWLAQVGQAIARAFGIARLVRAHAGGDPAALPAGFVAAAARLGWDDWRARRTLHFLSDTFAPAPWVALALAAGAGQPVTGATVATLAAWPLAALALPDDPAFDRAIVEDALRAMCLTSAQVAGSFRTRAQVPADAIAIDAAACAVVAGGRGALDPVAPRYWLPPAVAARITARQRSGYTLRLGALAAIPEAAAAICDASPGVERAGFALAPRVA